MEPYLVTCIIPAHNRPGRLREAVASVLDQDYRPIEIIIVDDGSTDETGAVADALAEEHSGIIRVIHQENAGPGVARQVGLERAMGEFIQYLDSDDLLLPDKFSRQVSVLEANPQAGICYGLTLVENLNSGERIVTHGTDRPHQRLLPAVLADRIWATLTPLYRHSVCEAIGPWSKRRILEDWDYDLRAALLDIELAYVSKPVAVKRHGMDDHAGNAWRHDEKALRDWIDAWISVAGYAAYSGVSTKTPEMQKLSRSLFWMAREAGNAGFPAQARELFHKARACAGPRQARGWDFRLYRLGAAMLGWRVMGMLSVRGRILSFQSMIGRE